MNIERLVLFARQNLDSLFIALTGILLILVYTNHTGPGVSPDSIVYVSVARNLNAHGALLDYNLKTLVDFPVFYPFFLSVVEFFTRTDLTITGPYLNAFLFAGIILISGQLIHSFKYNNRLYKIVILFSIAVSPALFDVYSMLWSETLFIFLSLLFILLYRSYLKKRTVSSLLICAAVAGIACITRYAGITIIASGLMLLFFDRALDWKKKITHLLSFGVIAVLPLLANLLHNRLATGLMTGPRESGITPLSENIYYFGSVVCQWMGISSTAVPVVSGVVIFVLIAAVIIYSIQAWLNKAYPGAEPCFTALFIVYTVFIIGISTLSHFEQINNRLISPLFIPMLIVLTAWIPRVLASHSPGNGRGMIRSAGFRKAILVVVLLTGLRFEYTQLCKLNEMYTEAKTYGIAGYTDDSWKNSAISRFLRTHQSAFSEDYQIYSNAHEAAYFNGNMNTESLPHLIDKDDIDVFFNKKGHYLIWFNAIEDTELLSLQTIRKHAEVVKTNAFADGSIYVVRPYEYLKKPVRHDVIFELLTGTGNFIFFEH